MSPETQTLFSLTLFLALSFLLAWSNRRHREEHDQDATTAAMPAAEGAEIA